MVQKQGLPHSTAVVPVGLDDDRILPSDETTDHRCSRIQDWIAYAERNGIRAVEKREEGNTGAVTILVFRHTIQGCKVEILTKENHEPCLYENKREAEAKIQQILNAPHCTQYGEIRAPQYLAVTL